MVHVVNLFDQAHIAWYDCLTYLFAREGLAFSVLTKGAVHGVWIGAFCLTFTSRQYIALAIGLVALCGSLPALAASPAVPFIAHRAVYDLTLAKATGASAPSAAW